MSDEDGIVTVELSQGGRTLRAVEPVEDEIRDDGVPAERPAIERGSVRAFDYLSLASPHSPTYRAIVAVFVEHREAFELSLSTAEVWDALAASGVAHQADDHAHLERLLGELAERGNLHKSQANESATTIADLRERRSRWRLTEAGFLAEMAARDVEESFARTGALRRTALAALRGQLEDDLAAFLTKPILAPDDGDVLAVLFAEVFAKTEDLRASAETFMTTLDIHLARPDTTLAAFADVRDAIFGHVDAFLTELGRSGPAIARAIDAAAAGSLDRLLDAAADAEPEPTFDGSDPVLRARTRLERRWHGLEKWFTGSAGAQPQYRALQARAEDAIGTLVRLLRRLNDARSRPLTRPRDFLTLARWFEQADADDVHRIWHAAFGLSPARHLGSPIDAPDEGWGSIASWWESPPVAIDPRIRRHGKVSAPTGHPGLMEDLSANLDAMLAAADEDDAPLEAAAARFTERGPMRMSELGAVDEGEFRLLRDWLSRALRSRRTSGISILVASLDGRHLVEVRTADEEALVDIETPWGTFSTPDYAIEVTSVESASEEAASA